LNTSFTFLYRFLICFFLCGLPFGALAQVEEKKDSTVQQPKTEEQKTPAESDKSITGEKKPELGKEKGTMSGTAPDAAAEGGTATDTTKLNFVAKAKAAQKKKPKVKKNIYFGRKIKKGFTKSGKGKNQIIEQFRYLKVAEKPNEQVPDKYYYDLKRKKIFKARLLPEKNIKILHGPYKKMQNGLVLEEGFFYLGLKHGRWERYNKNNILLDKDYYDQGFHKDAQVIYYDAGRRQIKEVQPFEYGEKTGTYVSYYPNGHIHWHGQYERGKRVGVWVEYFDFKNRKHYEWQYPESSFDDPFDPILVKEYDRNNTLIFEDKKVAEKMKAKVRAGK
jgi:antitoxin component YwqK of YwqJK toxin-antitoxin module